MDARVATKTIRLADLKPNERNPRTITTDAFRTLCESIRRDPEFMPLRPIVTDKDGIILGGNMRYRACIALGMTDVPASWVYRADHLTPEQRKRFVVVDNAPDGIAGEWDFEILAADWELPQLAELGFGPEELGLKDVPLNSEPDAQAGPGPLARCPKCGYEFAP